MGEQSWGIQEHWGVMGGVLVDSPQTEVSGQDWWICF